MNRYRTIAATALVAIGLALVVTWLRSTAPAPTAEVSVEDLLPPGEPITCEDLGQDEPGAPGSAAVVGRAVSGQVLTCPAVFDGLEVTYIGEVVGDVLARDGGSWVLANDDDYALRVGPLTAGGTPSGTNSGLTVWLPDPLDELADEPGRTDRRGDVLRVTGRIHRADPADGGGTTLRAEQVEVLAEAVTIDEPVHWRQVGVAAALAALALLVLWRERERRAS